MSKRVVRRGRPKKFLHENGAKPPFALPSPLPPGLDDESVYAEPSAIRHARTVRRTNNQTRPICSIIK